MRQNGARTRLACWANRVLNDGAAVLNAGHLIRDRKAHIARFAHDAEAVEQAHEIGVGPLVVDQEAGIERDVTAPQGDRDGVSMAAGSFVALKDRDVMVLGQ